MIQLLWVGLFLSMALFFSLLFWILFAGRARVRERINRLREGEGWSASPIAGPVSSTSRKDKHTGKKGALPLLASRIQALFEQEAGKKLNKHFQEQLQQAGMQITAEEMVAVILVCFFVPFVGGFLSGRYMMGFLCGIAFAFIPVLYIRIQQKRRLTRFNRQLNEMLTITSNSLKSGYSFLQSVQTISTEMPAPISEEFHRMIREVNMGLPMEESLLRLSQRVKSQDFELITTAILIQRQIGGNLSEILDNIGETIRERVRIQGEIKALTAQGRFSALIFMILPPGVTLMIYMMNPGYISVLFQHPLGLAMVVAAVIGQIIGFLVIRKIVAIDV